MEYNLHITVLQRKVNNYEIIQHLTKLPLTASQIKIALCVFVQTKKYGKESDAISLSQFVEKTGLSERHVQRTIPQLCKMGIIEKSSVGINKSKLPHYKFILCIGAQNIAQEHKNNKMSGTTPMSPLPTTPTPPTLNTEYVSKFCIFIILIYICGFSFSEEEGKIRGRVKPTPLNVIRIGRLISLYFGEEQIKKIGGNGRRIVGDFALLSEEYQLGLILAECMPKFTHITKTGLYILRTLALHYGTEEVEEAIRELAKKTQYDPALIYLQELLAHRARKK